MCVTDCYCDTVTLTVLVCVCNCMSVCHIYEHVFLQLLQVLPITSISITVLLLVVILIHWQLSGLAAWMISNSRLTSSHMNQILWGWGGGGEDEVGVENHLSMIMFEDGQPCFSTL